MRLAKEQGISFRELDDCWISLYVLANFVKRMFFPQAKNGFVIHSFFTSYFRKPGGMLAVQIAHCRLHHEDLDVLRS